MTQLTANNLDPFTCPYRSVLVFEPLHIFFRREKISPPSQTRGIPDVPNGSRDTADTLLARHVFERYRDTLFTIYLKQYSAFSITF